MKKILLALMVLSCSIGAANALEKGVSCSITCPDGASYCEMVIHNGHIECDCICIN